MPALKNARQPTPEGFYVYELIDPRTGAAFYVGKGKGRRAWSHEGAARSNRDPNGVKAEVIRNLHREGLRPAVSIVSEGLSEREAFTLERRMIAERRDHLTNIASGARTAHEVLQAQVREDLRALKPLCRLMREGVSAERLALWVRIRRQLVRMHGQPAV